MSRPTPETEDAWAKALSKELDWPNTPLGQAAMRNHARRAAEQLDGPLPEIKGVNLRDSSTPRRPKERPVSEYMYTTVLKTAKTRQELNDLGILIHGNESQSIRNLMDGFTNLIEILQDDNAAFAMMLSRHEMSNGQHFHSLCAALNGIDYIVHDRHTISSLVDEGGANTGQISCAIADALEGKPQP